MSVTDRRLKAVVMDADQIRRSLSRIAHEIAERNRGVDDLVLVGVFSKGDHLARRLAAKLAGLEGAPVAVGALDTSRHRDDRHLREPSHRAISRVPDVDGKVRSGAGFPITGSNVAVAMTPPEKSCGPPVEGARHDT